MNNNSRSNHLATVRNRLSESDDRLSLLKEQNNKLNQQLKRLLTKATGDNIETVFKAKLDNVRYNKSARKSHQVEYYPPKPPKSELRTEANSPYKMLESVESLEENTKIQSVIKNTLHVKPHPVIVPSFIESNRHLMNLKFSEAPEKTTRPSKMIQIFQPELVQNIKTKRRAVYQKQNVKSSKTLKHVTSTPKLIYEPMPAPKKMERKLRNTVYLDD